MRPATRVLTPLLSLAAVVAVLAGCDASSSGEGNGNGAGAPTSTGPQSSAATAVPEQTSGAPSPSAAEAATLVTALRAVDPALAIDSQGAVRNAVSLCAVLRSGTDPSDAVSGTFPDVTLDPSQQQAVVTAVTSGFCPLAGSGDTSGSPTPSASASATTS